ncbi:MAG: alanine racemase [Methyloprofundus sp.]|nr:alanine racemase [Methyloprofundus sp.]
MPVAAHIELNMCALQHNVAKVREYAPQSQLMAVIKANAYGHGLIRIAHALQGTVDAFAVARLDEAVRLRQAEVTGTILVLQGITQLDELLVVQQYQLDMVVHTEQQVELLEAADLAQKLNIWLKIDTGMHRLGIHPEQLASILTRLQQCQAVADSIKFMTHFANADDPQDATTSQQLQLFNTITQGFSAEKSSANSAAIIAWPASHQQWVRPGLMLYGAAPILGKSAAELGLLPVMSLYAGLIAIKILSKGGCVGYGGHWIAAKDTLLGVIAIGYGDGYPRHIRQGAPVLIGAQRVPIIGRVSMDMLAVDLSTYPDATIGEQVTLWGADLPVEEIADYADTIPYTLLCGITQRVRVEVTW